MSFFFLTLFGIPMPYFPICNEDAATAIVTEALSAWSSYARLYRTMRIPHERIRRDVTDLDGTLLYREIIENKRSPTSLFMLRFAESLTDAYYEDTIKCINSKYTFVLSRPSKDRSYALTNVHIRSTGLPGAIKQGEYKPKDRDDDIVWVYGLTTNQFQRTSETPSWHEIFSKEIHCLRITHVYPDHPTENHITFACTFKQGHKPECLTATVTLDMELYYLPVTIETRHSGIVSSGKNIYLMSPSGIPLLKKARWTYHAIPGATVNKNLLGHEVTTLDYEFNTLPESDFTLTAFGLPEPYGIEWERPIPWGLYIIGGTLGMVFVMGVVWRIRRWRAAA
jgi:hypothetical protein